MVLSIAAARAARQLGDFLTLLCLLFLSIVYIQIHTHLKWGGYG
jgi:hypothetical protein